jgi:hypothetical protein
MFKLVIFLLALFLGILLSRIWYKLSYASVPATKKIDKIISRHKGYHIHHSMYGLTSFMIVPLTLTHYGLSMALVGFGLGIIIDHTIEEGFIFITKDKDN